MKTTLKILAAIAMMFPVAAQAQQPTQAQIDEYCGLLAEGAEGIMRSRQIGMPLSKALEIAAIPPALPAYRMMTLVAYELPVYHSDEAQERAAARFRDRMHLECLKAHQ